MENSIENMILKNISDSFNFLKESFGISFLGYRKLYNNNKIFLLTPIKELKEYTENSLLFISPSLLTKIRLNDSMDYQIHYWSNRLNSPFCEFLYNHDLWYGISIFKKYETYTEIFAFCALRQHNEVVNFYLNNLTLFEQFIFYFKDKFNSTKYEMLPKFTLSSEYNSNLVEDEVKKQDQKIKEFFRLIDTKKYYQKINELTSITTRERECLAHFATGKTYKETATIMGISPRTIETYVKKLMNKFNCYSKSKLVNIYLSRFLFKERAYEIQKKLYSCNSRPFN